jgi:hypothetical protein
MASITDFIQNFKGGTRKNRFAVTGIWPDLVKSGGYDYDTTYHILATTLPPSYLGNVTIPYRGREANYAGDRIYDAWDIIILDDTTDNILWESFHKWQKIMNDHISNTHSFNDDTFRKAKKNWKVQHLGLDGNVLKTMNLVGCWPVTVTPISFNMTQNVYNSFAVKLSYDYFTVDGI